MCVGCKPLACQGKRRLLLEAGGLPGCSKVLRVERQLCTGVCVPGCLGACFAGRPLRCSGGRASKSSDASLLLGEKGASISALYLTSAAPASPVIIWSVRSCLGMLECLTLAHCAKSLPTQLLVQTQSSSMLRRRPGADFPLCFELPRV